MGLALLRNVPLFLSGAYTMNQSRKKPVRYLYTPSDDGVLFLIDNENTRSPEYAMFKIGRIAKNIKNNNTDRSKKV